jgi:hypothetical protein
MLFAAGRTGDRVQRLRDLDQHAPSGRGIAARRAP